MAAAKRADAIALLKADHRKVEKLFAEFETARSRKEAIAKEICTELTVHTMIEEEILYPACQAAIEDDDILMESYVEHDGAKVLVAEIEQGGPDDAFYEAKVQVLSEMIKHHVKEEEKPGSGLFAQARKAKMDLKALGDQLAARKQQLLAQIKAEGLPQPKTRSFVGGELGKAELIETPAR